MVPCSFASSKPPVPLGPLGLPESRRRHLHVDRDRGRLLLHRGRGGRGDRVLTGGRVAATVMSAALRRLVVQGEVCPQAGQHDHNRHHGDQQSPPVALRCLGFDGRRCGGTVRSRHADPEQRVGLLDDPAGRVRRRLLRRLDAARRRRARSTSSAGTSPPRSAAAPTVRTRSALAAASALVVGTDDVCVRRSVVVAVPVAVPARVSRAAVLAPAAPGSLGRPRRSPLSPTGADPARPADERPDRWPRRRHRRWRLPPCPRRSGSVVCRAGRLSRRLLRRDRVLPDGEVAVP